MNTNQSPTLTPNISAFLWALRKAEGTSADDGYQALFGYRPGNGKTFADFADHPRQHFWYKNKKTGKTTPTSAAGAYQFEEGTWDELVRKYPTLLPDFSPQSQDMAAYLKMAEKGADDTINAGNLADTVKKVKGIWASLPGNNANQPQRNFEELKQWYTDAGGNMPYDLPAQEIEITNDVTDDDIEISSEPPSMLGDGDKIIKIAAVIIGVIIIIAALFFYKYINRPTQYAT